MKSEKSYILCIYRGKKIYNEFNKGIIWKKMDTIIMNSKNSKTSDPHSLLFHLSYKLDLRKDKYIALSNLSIYYTCKSIKKSYKNNKFKISAPAWNEEFELPDRSYSISDIQDNFEYEEKAVYPSIRIYINKIENRTTLKIKTGYYLEFLTPETMKLLGSTKSGITKDEDGENVPNLEITEVVLVHCNIVSNQESRVKSLV